MRRIRTAKRQRGSERQYFPKFIPASPALGAPFLNFLGSCVGSACFRGRLMKYPCRFNRVTCPACHPRGKNAEPHERRVPISFRCNNKKTYCPRMYIRSETSSSSNAALKSQEWARGDSIFSSLSFEKQSRKLRLIEDTSRVRRDRCANVYRLKWEI